MSDDESEVRELRAQQIARALMGDGPIDADQLAASVTWQNSRQGALVGRDAVLKAVKNARVDAVKVDEVVTQGKAASVSGFVTRAADRGLFCVMLRFTSAAQVQVASIVDFEHIRGK